MTVLGEEDQNSTGADIEPQANDEELVTEIKYSEQREKNVHNFVTANIKLFTCIISFDTLWDEESEIFLQNSFLSEKGAILV